MALTDPQFVTLLFDTGHILLSGGDPLHGDHDGAVLD